MQQTSETYNTLLARNAPKQVRALVYRSNVAYTIYGQDRIVSAVSKAAMLDSKLTVGNCIAKELNLVIRNYAELPKIPRMAKIVMQFRLYESNNSYSEWLPKGTYFIDTRDEGNGVIQIDAFDPMLKAERTFSQPGEQGFWPRSDIAVVEQIAARIGVEIDPRTIAIINKGYMVQYPGFGEGAYTCRECLGFVGQMYGGNWIITDENKLRLVILGDIPVDINLLVDEHGDYITVGGYRIIVSR